MIPFVFLIAMSPQSQGPAFETDPPALREFRLMPSMPQGSWEYVARFRDGVPPFDELKSSIVRLRAARATAPVWLRASVAKRANEISQLLLKREEQKKYAEHQSVQHEQLSIILGAYIGVRIDVDGGATKGGYSSQEVLTGQYYVHRQDGNDPEIKYQFNVEDGRVPATADIMKYPFFDIWRELTVVSRFSISDGVPQKIRGAWLLPRDLIEKVYLRDVGAPCTLDHIVLRVLRKGTVSDIVLAWMDTTGRPVREMKGVFEDGQPKYLRLRNYWVFTDRIRNEWTYTAVRHKKEVIKLDFLDIALNPTAADEALDVRKGGTGMFDPRLGLPILTRDSGEQPEENISSILVGLDDQPSEESDVSPEPLASERSSESNLFWIIAGTVTVCLMGGFFIRKTLLRKSHE